MIELIKHTLIITKAEHPEVDSDDVDVIMEHTDFQTHYEQVYLPEYFTHDKITDYLKERDHASSLKYYNVEFLDSKPVKAYVYEGSLPEKLAEAIKDGLSGYYSGHGHFYESPSDWSYEHPTEEEMNDTIKDILWEVGLDEV